MAQNENLRLDTPILEKGEAVLGQSIGAQKPLGYEGTPLAPKKNEEPPKKAKGQTEITALEATFDQKEHRAVFLQEVVVKDPEFTVNCDRLTAFLKVAKSDANSAPAPKTPATGKPATGSASAKPSPSPEKKDSKEDSKGGGLDHAIADANPGNIVIITQDKAEADGSVTHNIGKGRKATYDANTGDIVLTGSPSVLQGINLCVATDDSTVMTLNRSGHMKVVGPHKTVIKDASASDASR
jgi:lipopolysaccharide export system protein LptA